MPSSAVLPGLERWRPLLSGLVLAGLAWLVPWPVQGSLGLVAWSRFAGALWLAFGLARGLGTGVRGAALAGLCFAGSGVVLAHLDLEMARFTAPSLPRAGEFDLVELGALLVSAGVVWGLRVELARRTGRSRWIPALSGGVMLGVALVVLRSSGLALSDLVWMNEAVRITAPEHPARAGAWCASLALVFALAAICTPRAAGLPGARGWALVAVLGWVSGPHLDLPALTALGILALAVLAGRGLEHAPRPARAAAGIAAGVLALAALPMGWSTFCPILLPEVDPPDELVEVLAAPAADWKPVAARLALRTHPGLAVARVRVLLDEHGTRSPSGSALELELVGVEEAPGHAREGWSTWAREDLDLPRVDRGIYQLRVEFHDESGALLGERIVWASPLDYEGSGIPLVPSALLLAGLLLCSLLRTPARGLGWSLVWLLALFEVFPVAAALPASAGGELWLSAGIPLAVWFTARGRAATSA